MEQNGSLQALEQIHSRIPLMERLGQSQTHHSLMPHHLLFGMALDGLRMGMVVSQV